ncbi:hypothetical protein BOVATA_021160 [Babesia ovata]|uniref:Copper transport protein n=1 Tax=Babesia ovata TaxID=189622 RepID=A0A2H6KC99_9APIC|nr:uncharacterized protein BOVATA_021160 [Babesia ovata]GBE60623.1 hypothetical protein BOVATA_021160 [Babesia ovata]
MQMKGRILKTLSAAYIAHILFFCSTASGVITEETDSFDSEAATIKAAAMSPSRLTNDASDVKNAVMTTLPEDMHDTVRISLDSKINAVPSAHCSGKEEADRAVERALPRKDCASHGYNYNGVETPLVSSATVHPCSGNLQQSHSDMGAGSATCNLKSKEMLSAARGCQGRACGVTNANDLADMTHGDAETSCCMAAYFHNSSKAVILFEFWRTTTALSYAISLMIIFLLSIFTVLLKALRKKANTILAEMNTCPYVLRQLAMFAIAYTVIFMDFCMMLIVMTFNLGIVLVACTGYALGYLLTCFRYTSSTNAAESESPIECDADCC